MAASVETRPRDSAPVHRGEGFGLAVVSLFTAVPPVTHAKLFLSTIPNPFHVIRVAGDLKLVMS